MGSYRRCQVQRPNITQPRVKTILPPEKRRLPNALGTRTHTQYIRCSTSERVSPLARRSSPAGFSVTRRFRFSDPPLPSPPHFSSPKSACSSGAGGAVPTVSPPHPSGESSTRAPRRVRGSSSASKKRRRFSPSPPSACVSVTATCKKRAVAESSCHRLCVSHEDICSRSSGAASRGRAVELARRLGEARVAVRHAVFAADGVDAQDAEHVRVGGAGALARG